MAKPKSATLKAMEKGWPKSWQPPRWKRRLEAQRAAANKRSRPRGPDGRFIKNEDERRQTAEPS